MPVRVLVLEPDVDLMESFQDHFAKSTEFHTRLTANGDECIELLASFRPDVFVLEPVLPHGVADRILEAVQNVPGRPYVPILVLTRFSTHTTADHPAVKSFLVKPQSLKNIGDAIQGLAADSRR